LPPTTASLPVRDEKEACREIPVILPAISRHLKVLERAGLITRRRAAQSRPTSLRPDALEQAEEWIDTCRVTWERRMDRLAAHLEEIQNPSSER
jgi:DNA-binding MarR family transcriptional regulator